MADTYSWAASVTGGSWQKAPNWTDTTTNATATTPPDAANAATVAGGAGTNFQILTGPGTAASLLLLGNTAFEGQFGAASVTIGSTIASLALGAIDLENHSTVAVGGPVNLLGDLELDGTQALFSTSLLNDSGTLYVVDGAKLLATAGTIGGFVYVDALGVAEFGTLGTAGAGSLTVDAGATLTLADGADVSSDIGLAGNLAVIGGADLEGNVNGAGEISIAATEDLDIFGTVDGLTAISDGGMLTDEETVANVGLITLGTGASATFGALIDVGTVQVGTGDMVSVEGNVTGGGAIEVGATAALQISGTLSGLGRIDLASGGTVAFTQSFGTLAPQDLNVPINLAGSNELLIDAGVSIGGLVSGFTIGDVIAVTGDESNPARLITGASLAAGGLALSDDGTVANVIDISAAGPFLTNAVGLPGGLPTGGSFSTFGTTDIILASGTATNLSSTGSVTVTGALGFGFEVLNGSGTATSLTFIDNTALEGSFTAGQVAITASTANTTAINAVDVQAGASLVATAGATISSNAEIDGAGARFAVAGTLALNSGELLVVNGGTVQATALTLNGNAGGATLDVDSAGAIEVGTLADAQAGVLLIDSGATLANLATNEIIGNVVDQGSIALVSSGFDIADLTIDGNLSGGGVLTTGTQDGLFINGNVTGLSKLVAGAGTDIDISGSLASSALVSLGSLGVLDVTGDVSGLSGVTIGANGQLQVFGSMTGVGPVSIGSLGIANIDGSVSGTGTFAIGAQAAVLIGGPFSGFSLASLAAGATLGLGGSIGSTDTVPILLGGTADTLDLVAGVNIGGTVSGFAVGDLIRVHDTLFQSTTLVTGASLAGGILSLTSDGTVTGTVAMAGNAGQQFLTNSVGLPDLTATDIVLPSATLTAIGSGGTVSGATGSAFDVLTGFGSTAALTFLGNLALEGGYVASGSATVGGTAALAVLDIEAGGSLSAGNVLVGGGLEVDGAGASLVTAGTLTLGGGVGVAEVFAANAGLIQAAAVLLAGGTGQGSAELAVDPAGRFEVGTAGLGAAGTLTIDAGNTLSATAATSTIQATIADNGLLTVGSGDLTLVDDLLGSGTFAVGASAEAQTRSIAGLGTIAAGTKAILTVEGNVTGVGTITEAAGATIEVEGSVSTSGGGITVGTSADLTIDGDLSGSGTLSIGAGAVVFLEGTVSGLSEIVIGAGGTLDLDGDDVAVPIAMGADSTLVIEPFASLTGVIQGFASGDAIAVGEAPSTIITEADLAGSAGGGSLLLSDDGEIVNTLSLTGSFGLQQFLTNVAGSGFGARTDVTLATPCFAAGSGVATVRGRVPVEALRIGDAVRVLAGGTRPVVWIGHRRIDCRRHPDPERVWPVQVRAHAFAPGQPSRELRLSPDHAVFADGVLIPVKHLINGQTIRQVRVDAVTYFHVELDRHDVMFAETLALESYLDTGNRAAFANGGTQVQLHPDFAPLTWRDACAELVQEGPRLSAVKQRLFARTGGQTRPPPGLRVQAGGRELAPDIAGPGLWRYAVPPRARRLHLVSPVWMPAACEAASLDRRSLGVRLFGVGIDGRPASLEGPIFGGGFHPVETTAEGECRWTDGRARLLLPLGTRLVTLQVGDGAAALTTRAAAAA